MSAALKKNELSDEGYQQMIASATQLNTPGSVLAAMSGVHGLTDVTGFGLLGHLLEICHGSKLAAEVEFDRVPLLPEALNLAKQGYAPGAAARNWASYGHEVSLPATMPEWQKNMLCDPQTSGGLLVACAQEEVENVLEIFNQQGFGLASVIGTLCAGEPGIVVK